MKKYKLHYANAIKLNLQKYVLYKTCLSGSGVFLNPFEFRSNWVVKDDVCM